MKKKMIDKFERFGRGFVLPVSILTFVGMILGIGSALSTPAILEAAPFLGWTPIAFFVGVCKAAGKATFDNLPIIFAVGLAIGLSKRRKEIAGLTALVGYLTFIWVLNYTLEFRGLLVDPEIMKEVGQNLVLGKQVMDLNVFGGMIIGVLAYYATKNFAEIKFHEYLSFFEGERFVPFVMICYASIFAVVASFVWPPIAGLISDFASVLENIGVFGVFLYGAGERLLIPFGLHHTLNTFISYTEVGGTQEICGELISGNVNMFAKSLECNTPVTPEMTKYFSGTFVVKMFGLPGAAFAMYKTSYFEHRTKVKSIMIGAAAASLIAGITEPLEFTFLFVAPLLYLLHAVLTGFAFVVMYLTGTTAIAVNGTGIINFFLFNVLNPSLVNWYGILWIGPMFFALYYFSFKFMIEKFDYKTPGREEELTGLSSKVEAKTKYGINKLENQASGLIKAHGGVDNIETVDACISRLRINVYDTSIVDTEIIKDELDALGVVVVGNQIQSVYGQAAKELKTTINILIGG